MPRDSCSITWNHSPEAGLLLSRLSVGWSTCWAAITPRPTDEVRAAFEFVAELHGAAGRPDRLAHDLRPVLQRHGLSTAPVDEISAAVELLRAYGPLSPEARIEVDLSLARGLRYYT